MQQWITCNFGDYFFRNNRTIFNYRKPRLMANIRRMYGKLWMSRICTESNKNVHLPARVSFLYLLGDLVVIERDFGWECSGWFNVLKSPLSHPKEKERLEQVSEHCYCFSVQIQDIHNFPYVLLMFAISLGYLWLTLRESCHRDWNE